MERLTPNTLTGSFDKAYLGNLTQQVNYITSKGAYAMIQPHNYGRFYGNIITDTAGFKTWWKNVAAQYKDNALVVFDVNNEFHDMDQTLVFNLNQAGIDGIRAAGATKQYITPEGNSWTGAWTWVSSGNAASLVSLKDPQNKLTEVRSTIEFQLEKVLCLGVAVGLVQMTYDQVLANNMLSTSIIGRGVDILTLFVRS